MKNIVLWVTVLLFSCASPVESQSGVISLMSPKDFQKKLTELPETILIDVRTPRECQGGMLENAQRITYGADDFESKIATLDKTKPTFVYCKTGIRSARAARFLESLGFTQIYDLRGGIRAWQQAGLNFVVPK